MPIPFKPWVDEDIRDLTPEQIAFESKDWPLASDKPWASGEKVRCPHCTQTGYAGSGWTAIHLHHVQCPCGKWVSKRGYHQHASRCDQVPEAERIMAEVHAEDDKIIAGVLRRMVRNKVATIFEDHLWAEDTEPITEIERAALERITQ